MVALDTEIAARYEPYIRSGRLGGGLLRWDRFNGEEARRIAEEMQVWVCSAPSRVPFLLATDHEGGTLFTQRRYGSTLFPGNMALGATGDIGKVWSEEAAYITGQELRSLGIRLNFAPVLDVNSNPDNPIIGIRSFGEEPGRVASLGAAAIRGYTRAGIAAAIKHFPGHGDTSVDSHLGLPISSRSISQLEGIDLKPFAGAIRAGALVVMPAHIVFPALGDPILPVTLSSAAINYLRVKLGFKGVVVSDSLDMGAIAGTYGPADSARRAFAAGCDLLLIGKGDFPAAYEALLEDARSGRLERGRLEASVDRILKLKKRVGLFAHPHPDIPLAQRRSPKALELAKRIAERSITLLRSDPTVLPLNERSGRLIVILPHPPSFAEEAGLFLKEIRKRSPRAESLELSVRPSPDIINTTVERAREFDTILLGLWSWGANAAEQIELGSKLESLGKPIVLIALLNPYGLRHFPRARAAIALYGFAPANWEAGARLLFGEIRPRGHLPVTVPGFAVRGDGLQTFQK